MAHRFKPCEDHIVALYTARIRLGHTDNHICLCLPLTRWGQEVRWLIMHRLQPHATLVTWAAREHGLRVDDRYEAECYRKAWIDHLIEEFRDAIENDRYIEF